MTDSTSIARNSAWMALGTIVSRITGFARLYLLAFTIGPATHAGLRRFHLPVHDDAPEVLGE